FLLAAVASIAIVPQIAMAQAPVTDDADGDDFHGDGSLITVRAAGIDTLDVLPGTSVVEGLFLQRQLDGQIGEILDELPGVSATSFAPGASRPVLRGFQGERVRVLTDGIGTLDVSNTSADHAVPVDPLTAQSIEVIRGPASLLYGNQAIGGAVNVIDKRIPRAIPDEPVHFDARGGYASASELLETGASVDIAVGEQVALHFSGSYRNTDDLEVGGEVFAPVLQDAILAEAAAAEDPAEAAELEELAETDDVLPNSATETFSYAGGIAFNTGESDFGFSVSYYDTDYGVPLNPLFSEEEEGEGEGGEGEEGEDVITIGLEQLRADFRGSLALGSGFFERLNTRFGYSNYTHTEFEGDETGTVFDVEGFEARAYLDQKKIGTWQGSVGFQYTFRDFEAIGEEAFVAPNITDQYAVFALQEVDVGPVEVDASVRYERTDVESDLLNAELGFDAYSGALSLTYEFMPNLRAGVSGSRVERAPGAEELFAGGPHIATQQFEIGSTDLVTESAVGVEGFVRGEVGPVDVSFGIYGQWFDDFIFLQGTGEVEDGLPVFIYLQEDVNYFGLEFAVGAPIYEVSGFQISADLIGDYIRATVDEGDPLPRIPPLRLLGGLEAENEDFTGRVQLQWVDEQDRVSPFETATDDFIFVDASLAWRPFSEEAVTLLAQVNNIFDVVGRRHASFTKDFVPLPGRDFRVSARLSF
ncbi:MAG: TonB-dependent receptor, partial [Pseudomonadota bacterium]